MPLDMAAILKQIDDVLLRNPLALEFNPAGDLRMDERAAAVTGYAAAIRRLAPPGSPYRDVADQAIENPATQSSAALLAGALQSLREDYASGYTSTFEELVHADVFSDYLEMAQELLDTGYKDPAAVIAGITLEVHVGKLAARNGITLLDSKGAPKKADALNAELKKAGAYATSDQKQVTAWQGRRNDAAHGDWHKYDDKQVALMIEGIRDFVARYPA